eukprot:CAMPEP_0174289610 /NCGR_PEP_ID=MMETSP0809-20121228/25648_1 /TAXON_ID=73025 ORGANISM="Eutreptiella gymnastica-like, Strain CCMP1594" /NCGR_SAMPLE_ID=MMETSP0809 /ASSEMBLY_ACC=CAM_ASM_000658 /LENGTH=79 /DNA_ID=CAMNT_0015387659 /DNA_START=644 /DNA_END=883 /DNA_ORIENTATION=+
MALGRIWTRFGLVLFLLLAGFFQHRQGIFDDPLDHLEWREGELGILLGVEPDRGQAGAQHSSGLREVDASKGAARPGGN